jgi:hypothetical protein
MAKRMTKAESAFAGAFVVLGLIVGGVLKIVETTGIVIPLLILAAGIGLYFWHKQSQRQKRLSFLRSKYHDEELVRKIDQSYFWEGQTQEQLLDSLGQPIDIDQKLLKTKTKEVWKYHHRGANRYGLRITLENGVVVEWDKKA